MAATDLERLVVQLSADIKKYENALNRANGVAIKQTRNIQSKFDKMNKSVSSSFAGLGIAATAAYAAVGAVGGLKDLSDAATRIDNALKVAGLSGAELESVYQKLYASAQKNAAPLESLATLYGRASQVQKELGVTTDELATFTDKVAVALRVNGRSAEETQGALLQLGQALGSARIFAEEFNSINEGARPILQAVAAGIKEAGGSVSKLKQLVIEGKVSNQAFFRGFEAGAVILEQKAANAVLTVSQATGNLKNSLINIVREFNNATGASKNMAGGINNIAAAMGDLDVSGFIAKIQSAKKAIDEALQSFGNAQVFKDFNAAMGITNADGSIINPDVSAANQKISALERDIALLQAAIENNTNLGFDNSEALARLGQFRTELAKVRAEAAALAPTVVGIKPDGTPVDFGTNGLMGGPNTRGGARKPPPVVPVSLADYKVAGAKDGKAKQNAFDEALKSQKEQLDALNAEIAVRQKLNPLAADFEQKLLAAKTAQELLTAAQKAGRAITPELTKTINDVSNAYAAATAKVDALKEAQDKAAQSAKDAIEFQKDLLNGALSDMRTALEDGKITWEELGNVAANVLNKIADKLQNMIVDQLFDKNLGGLFGGLLGGVTGATGGSGSGVSIPSAASIPSAPSMAKVRPASGGAQNTHVTVGLVKNGLNIEAEVVSVARVEAARVGQAGLEKFKRGEMKREVLKTVRNPRRIG